MQLAVENANDSSGETMRGSISQESFEIVGEECRHIFDCLQCTVYSYTCTVENISILCTQSMLSNLTSSATAEPWETPELGVLVECIWLSELSRACM